MISKKHILTLLGLMTFSLASFYCRVASATIHSTDDLSGIADDLRSGEKEDSDNEKKDQAAQEDTEKPEETLSPEQVKKGNEDAEKSVNTLLEDLEKLKKELSETDKPKDAKKIAEFQKQNEELNKKLKTELEDLEKRESSKGDSDTALTKEGKKLAEALGKASKLQKGLGDRLKTMEKSLAKDSMTSTVIAGAQAALSAVSPLAGGISAAKKAYDYFNPPKKQPDKKPEGKDSAAKSSAKKAEDKVAAKEPAAKAHKSEDTNLTQAISNSLLSSAASMVANQFFRGSGPIAGALVDSTLTAQQKAAKVKSDKEAEAKDKEQASKHEKRTNEIAGELDLIHAQLQEGVGDGDLSQKDIKQRKEKTEKILAELEELKLKSKDLKDSKVLIAAIEKAEKLADDVIVALDEAGQPITPPNRIQRIVPPSNPFEEGKLERITAIEGPEDKPKPPEQPVKPEPEPEPEPGWGQYWTDTYNWAKDKITEGYNSTSDYISSYFGGGSKSEPNITTDTNDNRVVNNYYPNEQNQNYEPPQHNNNIENELSDPRPAEVNTLGPVNNSQNSVASNTGTPNTNQVTSTPLKSLEKPISQSQPNTNTASSAMGGGASERPRGVVPISNSPQHIDPYVSEPDQSGNSSIPISTTPTNPEIPGRTPKLSKEERTASLPKTDSKDSEVSFSARERLNPAEENSAEPTRKNNVYEDQLSEKKTRQNSNSQNYAYANNYGTSNSNSNANAKTNPNLNQAQSGTAQNPAALQTTQSSLPESGTPNGNLAQAVGGDVIYLRRDENGKYIEPGNRSRSIYASSPSTLSPSMFETTTSSATAPKQASQQEERKQTSSKPVYSLKDKTESTVMEEINKAMAGNDSQVNQILGDGVKVEEEQIALAKSIPEDKSGTLASMAKDLEGNGLPAFTPDKRKPASLLTKTKPKKSAIKSKPKIESTAKSSPSFFDPIWRLFGGV